MRRRRIRIGTPRIRAGTGQRGRPGILHRARRTRANRVPRTACVHRPRARGRPARWTAPADTLPATGCSNVEMEHARHEFGRLWRWRRRSSSPGSSPAGRPAPRVPARAPPTASSPTRFTLKDMHGKEVNLARLSRAAPSALISGRPGARPARRRFPCSSSFRRSIRTQSFTVLGVSIDDRRTRPPQVRRGLQNELSGARGARPGHDSGAYDAVITIPVTWFIRADGSAAEARGHPATKEWFETQIKRDRCPSRPGRWRPAVTERPVKATWPAAAARRSARRRRQPGDRRDLDARRRPAAWRFTSAGCRSSTTARRCGRRRALPPLQPDYEES